jgi:hypothetical protein
MKITIHHLPEIMELDFYVKGLVIKLPPPLTLQMNM